MEERRKRYVAVSFGGPRTYTYKTWDPEIVKGDKVLVKVGVDYRVVDVVDVDIDFDEKAQRFETKIIVARVDLGWYEEGRRLDAIEKDPQRGLFNDVESGR